MAGISGAVSGPEGGPGGALQGESAGVSPVWGWERSAPSPRVGFVDRVRRGQRNDERRWELPGAGCEQLGRRCRERRVSPCQEAPVICVGVVPARVGRWRLPPL